MFSTKREIMCCLNCRFNKSQPLGVISEETSMHALFTLIHGSSCFKTLQMLELNVQIDAVNTPCYLCMTSCLMQHPFIGPHRGGVYTPGSAFARTTLIDRLNKHGIQFSLKNGQ